MLGRVLREEVAVNLIGISVIHDDLRNLWWGQGRTPGAYRGARGDSFMPPRRTRQGYTEKITAARIQDLRALRGNVFDPSMRSVLQDDCRVGAVGGVGHTGAA